MADPSPSGLAVRGARRFLVLGIAGLRVSYLATGIGTPVFGGPGLYRSLGADLALLAAATAWSVLLFLERLPVAATVADVGVAVLLLGTVTWLCVPAERLSWGNWAYSYSLSAACLAAVRLSAPAATACVAVLLGAFISAELGFGLDSAGARSNLAGNAAAFPWFAGVARAAWRYLRRSADRLDEATVRILRTETARAAERAREAERAAQYRRLHDTVLATLTTIARGGLDHRDDLVRRRCAEDAAYLRRLLTRDGAPASGAFADALARIADRMEAVGLRVHLMCDLADTPIPDEVADELALAVQEALNNTRRHSGAADAWVTATVEDRVTIRVVDRGCGFRRRPEPASGTGIRESILNRLTELGGCASVDSVPGEGTLVELRWPS